MLHRSKGRGPWRSTLWGSALPSHGARGAPQAATGSSWSWWVSSCLEVLFSARAAPPKLGPVCRVPRPPPSLGTNAASTRFPWLSLTAPACFQAGIPQRFTCRRCLLVRSKRSKPGADPRAGYPCWAPSRGRRMLPCCHGSLRQAPPPELHSALASLQTRIILLTSWCHNKMGFEGPWKAGRRWAGG